MMSFKVLKINYKAGLFIIVAIILFFSLLYTFSFAKNEEYIELPIIMYHSVLKSKSGKYIVHPDTLESDFKYIQSKGYTAITMTELINYVYGETSIPEKPIIITFDDGYYNNLSYAVPLLHKYNMKAVISIVGKYTDAFTNTDEANPNYGHLRWKDINNLISDGCIEFQNHTYNLHSNSGGRKGCRKLPSETLEHYTSILSSDISKLQDEFSKNCNGYVPNTFTYPYGAISDASTSILKSLGFKASLSCYSGVNYISKNAECLYQLKRNNREYGTSSERFFSKLLK